jgi:DNA invertase Pin-like site-specific DNA recombinase
MKNKVKVWAYYRVSSDRQGPDGEDFPMQKAQCHSFAEQKGWQITKELTEKLSGYKTAIEDREALKIIKQGAVTDDFDILLVYHSDRLGRQIEYSLWIASLYYLSKQVWSVKEGELKNQKHADSLQNHIRYWQSEGESKKTSMRVKDAMKQLNEEGYYLGGTIPYGYQLVDTGVKRNSKKDKTIKKIVVNPDEAKVVELIFELTTNKLMGGSTIAQLLNGMGLSNRGKLWRHNTITRMQRNPIYMGHKKYNTCQFAGTKSKQRKETKRYEWLKQPFNPDLVIVSEEQFKKTQELMDKRAKENGGLSKAGVSLKSMVLLSGIAVCAYCGHKLKSDFTNKKRVNKDGTVIEYRTYRYSCHYAKNNPIGHGKRCYGSVTIDNQVEEEVVKAIRSIKLDDFNSEKVSSDFEQLEARKIQLKEFKEQYDDVSNALISVEKLFDEIMLGKSKMNIQFVSNKIEEFGAKKIDLLEKIDMYKKEIERAEANGSDIDKLKYQLENWIDTYKNCIDLQEKKVMLSKVVREVVISKDSFCIKFNTTIEKALKGSLCSYAKAMGNIEKVEVYDE